MGVNEQHNHQSDFLRKKVVLKYFAIFTGKQLRWISLFNKAAGLKACNFIKNILQRRCFPVDTAKFLRAPIASGTENF